MEYFDGDVAEQNYKLILIGHTRVGKTSIINRYVNDNFNDSEQSSQQMQIMKKLVKVEKTENTWVQLSIWDTLGQERYHSLSPIFFRKAIGVFLVFDCSSMETFQKLEGWFESMAQYVETKVLVMLLGNKCDLPQREVPYNLAMEYARNRNLGYLEVSAKSGINIKNAFNCLVREIYRFSNPGGENSNTYIESKLSAGASKDLRAKGKSIKLNSQLHQEDEDEYDEYDGRNGGGSVDRKSRKQKLKKDKKDRCERC